MSSSPVVEVHPYSRWASPAGQRLLGALTRRGGDDRTDLTSVAVHGWPSWRWARLRC
ncbi:hypothetical protein [Streptomyces cellulosae]|uniref:Uncharacterized protein n=1 Tax=Streptomyces cellulosae TaxID=1968 RepID=A0ABW7YCP9_STRCE